MDFRVGGDAGQDIAASLDLDRPGSTGSLVLPKRAAAAGLRVTYRATGNRRTPSRPIPGRTEEEPLAAAVITTKTWSAARAPTRMTVGVQGGSDRVASS